jgi:hypothetical protein
MSLHRLYVKSWLPLVALWTIKSFKIYLHCHFIGSVTYICKSVSVSMSTVVSLSVAVSVAEAAAMDRHGHGHGRGHVQGQGQ